MILLLYMLIYIFLHVKNEYLNQVNINYYLFFLINISFNYVKYKLLFFHNNIFLKLKLD